MSISIVYEFIYALFHDCIPIQFSGMVNYTTRKQKNQNRLGFLLCKATDKRINSDGIGELDGMENRSILSIFTTAEIIKFRLLFHSANRGRRHYLILQERIVHFQSITFCKRIVMESRGLLPK